MSRHKHGLGPWVRGGPVARDRFCMKDGCVCDQTCCWQTQAGGSARWVKGLWRKPKKDKKVKK